jgi:type 2 lantibiotic biosynthesis protein LanM
MRPPQWTTHAFSNSTWLRALTLKERVALLRTGRPTAPDVVPDTELAERLMRRWRSQHPFSDGSYFSRRLALDGITEDEMRCVLGEPHEAIASRLPATPAWLTELAEAFRTPTHRETHLPLPDALRGHTASGFLEMIAPLMARGRDRLREGLQTIKRRWPQAPFETESAVNALFENLPSQLLPKLAPTLVLELNVARLQGVLTGNTPAERFHSFLRLVRGNHAAVSILQNYPTLARQLVIHINNWVDFSLEFVNHLCEDWSVIRLRFGADVGPGLLSQVHGGLGDTHNGGKAVLMVEFEGGLKLVYKPRSMAVDLHFQELLTWINERGDHPPFLTLRIHDSGTHGWSEYVAASGCDARQELVRFYERQGGYLAILYALEAVDFHYENLIASGEHPVLVDLESLFHPRLVQPELSNSALLAADVIDQSVLRVGLLPRRIWSDGRQQGIDLSGLGAAAGQITPQAVPYWEGGGTDEMHIARKRMAVQGALNRPTLGGVAVNALDYAEGIVAGFTRIYRLLLERRDELLSEDGPLAPFSDDPVRILLRPTRTYGELLQGSFHSDFLSDALERDRYFDQLWVGVGPNPQLARVISAEREDLHGGDIPMFTTRPGLRDVWPSSGESLKDFFERPGMALVHRRLELMGEHDRAQQLWFIRASLTTLSAGVKESRYSQTEPRGEVDRDRLLAAARSIGVRLEASALRAGDEATWIGLMPSREGSWSLAPLGLDTYAGLPGVALFLGHLGVLTGVERFEWLAQAALRSVRRRVEQQESSVTSIGGFAGWGGIIYTFAHLGTLWNQPALFDEAEAIVKFLPDLIKRDEEFDILGGAAGCIAGLLSLYRRAPSPNVLSAAVMCGDRLLQCARPVGSSVGWTSQTFPSVMLAGFSHGAAGIAWSLLDLSALTGEARFHETAVKAIEYERSIFSLAGGNWPDLRETGDAGQHPDGDRFMVAWCHGAPGIGMARLRSLRHLDDETIRAEVEVALKTTLAHGFGKNHSLCHGDLGNLDLVLTAAEELGDPRLSFHRNRLAALILESIGKNGWICGTPQGVETPGLMVGLAGIGSELLRLAEPARVPSVLGLAPPADSFDGAKSPGGLV